LFVPQFGESVMAGPKLFHADGAETNDDSRLRQNFSGSIESTIVHTGAYSYKVQNFINFPIGEYPAGGKHAINFWFYTSDATPTANTTIVDSASSVAADDGIIVQITTSGFLLLRDANGTSIETGTTALSTATWHHICMVWDPNTASGDYTVFLDGIEELDGTGLDTLAATTSDIYNLRGDTDPIHYFDDIVIYEDVTDKNDFLNSFHKPRVHRYRSTLNSATGEGSFIDQDLDAGVWVDTQAVTPVDTGFASFNGGIAASGVFYNDAGGSAGTGGPNTDTEVGDKIIGVVANWRMQRSGGGGTAQWGISRGGQGSGGSSGGTGVSVDSGKTMDVSGEMTTAGCMKISEDGTHIYVGDRASPGNIFQYDLSTGFDLSTGSYASKTLDTTGEATGNVYFDISSDGLELLVGDSGTDDLIQYTMSTAWDLGSATWTRTLAATVINQLAVSRDGTKLITSANGSSATLEFTLSTPWDVSTGDGGAVGGNLAAPNSRNFQFSDDGRFMMSTDGASMDVHLLRSAFQASTLETAIMGLGPFDPYTDATNIGAACWGDAGNRFFVVESLPTSSGDGLMKSYTLSDPYSTWNTDSSGASASTPDLNLTASVLDYEFISETIFPRRGEYQFQGMMKDGGGQDLDCSHMMTQTISALNAPGPVDEPRTVTGATSVNTVDSSGGSVNKNFAYDSRTVTGATEAIELSSAGGDVSFASHREVGSETMPLRQGLIVWFDFEEPSGNRLDTHTSGMVLTENILDTAITTIENDSLLPETWLGNAVSFDDGDPGDEDGSYLRILDAQFADSVLDFTNGSPHAGSFTWSVRAKRTSALFDDRGIWGIGSGAAFTRYGLRWGFNGTDDRFIFTVQSDTGGSRNLASTVNVADQWYHIMGWYDADTDTMGLTVDDTATTTRSDVTGGIATTTADFCVGRHDSSGADANMDGPLDQLIFWDRVLTADERTEMNTRYLYPVSNSDIRLTSNDATVARGRVVGGTTEITNVAGTNATVDRVTSTPRNVTGVTQALALTTNPAALNVARGVGSGTSVITFEISEGAVVNTTYVDGGTEVVDPLGDWINEAQAVDGIEATGSTNVTTQLPGDIGPLELSGLAVIPTTGKALRTVKARIHGSATGINGTTYSVEVEIFSAGELLDTITITDEASHVWSSPQSTVSKPSGGWNWTKFAALDFVVKALGTGGAPEPEVSINVIEIESTYGRGTPPSVNLPLVVTGTPSVNLLTANLSDTNWNRVVTGTTEVLNVANDPASLNVTRGVAGTTEVINAVGTPAGVNGRRVVGSTVGVTALVENASSINRTRGATADPEVLALAGTLATVDVAQPRNVVGDTETITATGNASIVNRTRGTAAATEVVTLTESASVITRNRVASALTEVATLATNVANLNRTRLAVSASEVVTLSSAGGSVVVGRLAAGITEVITLSTNNAGVNRTRGTAATTEVLDVLANSAAVAANRGVISAVEALIMDGIAAIVTKVRPVSGSPEVLVLAGTEATVERGAAVPRVVTGVTETIALSATPAGVNGRRVVGSTVALSTVVENAASVNRTRGTAATSESILMAQNPAVVEANRGVIGSTEVLSVSNLPATVETSTGRIVTCAVEAIALAENAAGVNMTRGVGSAVEALQLSSAGGSVVKAREILSATEVLSLAGTTATVVRHRTVQGIVQNNTITGTPASVFRGANLDVTGLTAGMALTEGLATIVNGRSIVCSTSPILLASLTSLANRSRQVGSSTELLEVTEGTAQITKTRTGAQPGNLIWAHPGPEEFVLVDGRMIQL
jgi:hypothetical protein